MSISIQNLTYIHPDKEILFENISFSIERKQKIALIGNNGSGKSTLLKIIGGELPYTSGTITYSSLPYYIPQHFGQYNHLSMAEALSIKNKLDALQAILSGDASENNFLILDEDWAIEEKATSALDHWGLKNISLDTNMDKLSGGEKTKVFLAGISIHQPEIILLDEPTNHLDEKYRKKLYRFISQTQQTMIIVSHDKSLLNLMEETYELSRNNIAYYPGNYDFYAEQKAIQTTALYTQLDEKEKELRLARKTAKEVAERSQKRDVRNKKGADKKGIARIMINTLRNKAENSTSKLLDTHDQKIESIGQNISDLRHALPEKKDMKTNFDNSQLHTGKILITAQGINFKINNRYLWHSPVNIEIKSGDRIQIKGMNGSGKTTLIHLLTGELFPTIGKILKSNFKYIYLDQEYSIIDDNKTVLEQAQSFATITDDEIKIILNRFLFPHHTWNKLCIKLSGGEKMRLALACLMLSSNTPDIFILDEPTNNLDIHNTDILISTIREYKGTILLVTHDHNFSEQVGIDQYIEL